MTSGSVVSTHRPLVPLTILDGSGNPQTLRVVLDTGFTGQVSLPDKVCTAAGHQDKPVC